jgi:osmotically-inducible protein OsmY
MKMKRSFLHRIVLSISLLFMVSSALAAKLDDVTKYANDTVITATIKEKIFVEPKLKSSEINVETLNGRTQLSGFVSSRASADKAVSIANSVTGVKHVHDDMQIK